MSMAVETCPASWCAAARLLRVVSVWGWLGPRIPTRLGSRASYMSMAVEAFPAPWWAPARFPRVASVWGWSGPRASASMSTASLRVRAVCGRPIFRRDTIVSFMIPPTLDRPMWASWGEWCACPCCCSEMARRWSAMSRASARWASFFEASSMSMFSSRVTTAFSRLAKTSGCLL